MNDTSQATASLGALTTPGLRPTGSSFASAPPTGQPTAAQTTGQPTAAPPTAPTTDQPTAAPAPQTVTPGPAQTPPDTFEEILEQLFGLIAGARPMPLGSSVMMSKQDEVLNLIAHAMERLPEEIQQAKWVLKERDDVLAKAQADAALLLDDARSKAAQLVQKTEVVRSAERRAHQVLEDAKTNARRQQLRVDDYCEQVLGQFEQAISYVLHQVTAARGALAPEPLRPDELAHIDGTGGASGAASDATQRHEAVPHSDVPKAGRGKVYDQEKLEPHE